MMLSMLVLLYVCVRFGFEMAGVVGAIVPLALFAAAEVVLTLSTRPLQDAAHDLHGAQDQG